MPTMPYLNALGGFLNGPGAPPPPTGTATAPLSMPGTNFDAGAPPPTPAPTINPYANSIAIPSPEPKPPAPPPPPVPPPAAPAPPPRGPGIFEPQFHAINTSAPAREVNMRGPKAQALLDKATNIGVDANKNAEGETYRAYAQAEAAADKNVAAAAGYRAGLEKANAQRAEELDAKAKEIAADTNSLSKQRMDSSADPLHTIGGIASVLLSMAPYGIGKVAGPMLMNQVNVGIQNKIKAQEFAYKAKLDANNAKRSEYGMLVDKWGSPDVAKNIYAASLKDEAATKMDRAALELKGTEVGNQYSLNAETLRAGAEKDRANALKFVPAQAGRQFVVQIGNQMLPAPVSAAEANKIALEQGIKPQQAMGQEAQKAGLDIIKEGAKGDSKKSEQSDKGAQYISEKLQTAGIPGARASADTARSMLMETPRGYAERVARATKAPSSLIPEANNKREAAWQTFTADTMKAFSGAGMSDKERETYLKMLNSAGSDSERLDAVRRVEDRLNAAEKNIRAGASPEAQVEYDKRLEAAKGGAETPKSAKKEAW